jgi:DNA-binding transcriptional regulator YiaG
MRGRTTTHARQDKVVATNTPNLAVMKEMDEPRGSSSSEDKALKTVGAASTSAKLARLTPISPSLPRRTLSAPHAGPARRRRPVRVSGGCTQLGPRFAASWSAYAGRRMDTGALHVHQKCPGSEDACCPVQVLGRRLTELTGRSLCSTPGTDLREHQVLQERSMNENSANQNTLDAQFGRAGRPAMVAGFGVALRRHRERLLLTQEALAQRAAISVGAIRDFESGRVRRPRDDTVRLLSDALGLIGEHRWSSMLSPCPKGRCCVEPRWAGWTPTPRLSC